MAVQAPELEAQLPADAAGSPEIFTPANDMAPIITVGGLKSDITPWRVYSPILASSDASPAAERFLPVLQGGLASFEDMNKHLEEGIQAAYEQARQRLVVACHSLSGLLVTEAAVDHPEWISDVICMAGLQAGMRGEKAAAKLLKHVLGNPVTAANLQEDSDLMTEHKEKVASEWSPDTSLHIVAPTTDILIPPQQGLSLELPPGQKPEKRMVVPRLMFESVSRRVFGVPDDTEVLKSIFGPADHFNIALTPAVISYIRGVRREAAGAAEAISLHAPLSYEALPAVA